VTFLRPAPTARCRVASDANGVRSARAQRAGIPRCSGRALRKGARYLARCVHDDTRVPKRHANEMKLTIFERARMSSRVRVAGAAALAASRADPRTDSKPTGQQRCGGARPSIAARHVRAWRPLGVGRPAGRPVAAQHVRDAGPGKNSTFLVLIRLPGERDATLQYVERLRPFDGPLWVGAGCMEQHRENTIGRFDGPGITFALAVEVSGWRTGLPE
jgi:hypothetical protein